MGFFDELKDEITDALHPGGAEAADAVAAWSAPVAPGAAPGAPGARIVHSSVTINGAPATPADLAPFETISNMDLNGDGVIGDPGATAPASGDGGAPAPGAPHVVAVNGADAAHLIHQFAGAAGAAGAASASVDPVGQLERLAALHASGALSDAEFDAAKRAVLGDAG